MKRISNSLKSLILLSTIALVVACNDDDQPTVMAELSLYEKLGGTMKVSDPNNPDALIEQGRLSFRSVVDTTIQEIVSDIVAENEGNLAAHFAPILAEVGAGNTTNLAVLSKNLTDFFSVRSCGGATNTYNGLNMRAAHDPEINPRMGVKSTDADYTKFIGYMGTAAGKNGVTDTAIINEVVAFLETLRAPIVQAP